MDSEILVHIISKYNSLKSSVAESLVMNDPGFEIKHSYHIGHRIDSGKKSVFAQVRVGTHRGSFMRRAIKSYYLGDCQEFNSDIIFPKRPGLKLSMILNEIQIQCQFDSPFLCKIHEVFLEAKYLHLVLDYCKGGEIYDYLAVNKSFTIEEAIPIFIQCLEAVKYMHSMGITHRAICIENIMFYDKERTRIKIISFGSATRGDKFTEKYGCAMYMAPEVFEGLYDIKCDIWSLGVTFYSMVVGCQPFQGKNLAEIIKKVTLGQLPKNPVWGNLPKNAKEFIKSMMQKESNRPNASELLDSSFLAVHSNRLHLILFKKYLKALKIPKPQEEFLIKVRFSNRIKAHTVKILNSISAIPDINYIEKVWAEMDLADEGKIQIEKLEDFLKKQCVDNKELVSKFLDIFRRFDTNKEGLVLHEDFLATIIMLNDKTLLLQAFEILDEDKNGIVQPVDFCRFNLTNFEEFELLFNEAIGKDSMGRDDFYSLIMKFSS